MMAEFDEAAPFEPFPGRSMKEYVTVPAAVYDNPIIFRRWLDKAAACVAALPPKLPKPKTTKKDSS